MNLAEELVTQLLNCSDKPIHWFLKLKQSVFTEASWKCVDDDFFVSFFFSFLVMYNNHSLKIMFKYGDLTSKALGLKNLGHCYLNS